MVTIQSIAGETIGRRERSGVREPPCTLFPRVVPRSGMSPIRRLVVDVLKPHDPPLPEFASRLADVESVAGVTVTLVELDREVQNVKLTFEGETVEYDAVEAAVERLGGTVHSVDEVACGEYIVEDRQTPQD